MKAAHKINKWECGISQWCKWVHGLYGYMGVRQREQRAEEQAKRGSGEEGKKRFDVNEDDDEEWERVERRRVHTHLVLDTLNELGDIDTSGLSETPPRPHHGRHCCVEEVVGSFRSRRLWRCGGVGVWRRGGVEEESTRKRRGKEGEEGQTTGRRRADEGEKKGRRRLQVSPRTRSFLSSPDK
jgi:hypothetical protein